MPKVLIAPMTLAHLGGPYEESLRGAGFELVYPTRPLQLTEDGLLQDLNGVCGDPALEFGHNEASVAV